MCAETLRQEGFKGRIVIATKENVLPYDRPKLSKALHLTAEEIQLRPPSFYHDNNIEVLLEKEVRLNYYTESTVYELMCCLGY